MLYQDSVLSNEESDMVLRITIGGPTCRRKVLKLEGSLHAEWAELLKLECSVLIATHREVCLDLSAVNFVDRTGIATLRQLSRAGVEILCPAGPVASALEGEGIHVNGDPDHGRAEDAQWSEGPGGDPE